MAFMIQGKVFKTAWAHYHVHGIILPLSRPQKHNYSEQLSFEKTGKCLSDIKDRSTVNCVPINRSVSLDIGFACF